MLHTAYQYMRCQNDIRPTNGHERGARASINILMVHTSSDPLVPFNLGAL